MFFRSNPLKTFQRALGRHKVLISEEDLLTYSFDTTAQRVVPQLVVLVESTEDVRTTVEFAMDEGYAVTVRGAGTGMSGGSVPLKSGIVLSTERMNFIYELDTNKKTMLVAPGITTAAVQEEAAKHHLFYPPDPSSHKVSTIGGNVAENAGGLRCIKYGTTKNYVAGLEFVTARGEICYSGALNADSMPYDLTPLLIGSEGTLAIYTAILLSLIPAPAAHGTLRVLFPTLEQTTNATIEILATGVIPAMSELLDRQVLEAVTAYTGLKLSPQAGALLLLEVDGEAEAVRTQISQIEDVCRKNQALEVLATQDRIEAEKLWYLRRSVSPAMARLAPGKLNEDVCVPRSRLTELVQAAQRLARRFNLSIPCFGHAGDGNLHLNVMYDPSDTLQRARAHQAVEEIFRETIALGGTISGEHGIGSVKKDFLRLQMSSAEIDTLRKIKEAFDPEGLLNPGKVIPD